jgi:acyl-CoA reductase-like NAD-dependent aldehyde dehydrogenase
MPARPTLRVRNPATGKVLETLRADDAAGVRARFRAARAAQPAWAAVPLDQRIAAIGRFAEKVAGQRERLAATLTSEVGKPIRQSRNELAGFLDRLAFFTAETPSALRPETVLAPENPKGAGLTERITQEPLGVVANISAWNYPYFVGGNVFIPALLTGNAVLYKPSEFAALTGLAIARLLHESGIPPEIFVPLIGGPEVGSALLRQPVDGVYFTGSYGTGLKIARALGGRMIRVQLELGGKDPVYVCDDVGDVAKVAAAVADGAFYNTGQSCCSVERIYVHRRIFEPFLRAFVAEVKGYQMGDPFDEATYLGPLTRGPQRAVLEAQIAEARRKGAKVLLGGKRRKGAGNYFAPTVLVGVDHSMAVMREESFGPVIGLMPVADDHEALRLMNDTPYGLTAGVYTPDRVRAEKLLAKVKSGSAYWNCCDRVSPRLPWSGLGRSGMGLTLSRAGIQAFTRPKAWHLKPA